MAAISNDDFLDTSITENWNCPKSRAQRSGSKVNQKPSLFSDPRRKSCITEFEADLGKFDFTRFMVCTFLNDLAYCMYSMENVY